MSFANPTPRHRDFQRMVVRHLEACAAEAKQDYADLGDTPSAAALVAISQMMLATAWSLGASLAAGGVKAEPMRSGLMREMIEQFDEGFSRPGEGKMF